MSNETGNHPDHEEIFSLLPWYANQTLEGHQRAAVSSHLEGCEECQRELQFLTSLNDSARSDAQHVYSLHADVEKDLASVMSRVDTHPHQTNTVTSGVSFLQQKLGDLFRFPSTLSVPQWGATALAGLFVAVVGFQFFHSQPDDDYSVLSSPATNNTAMRLSVEVMPALDQEQAYSMIQQELDKLGQQIDVEPNASGGYLIVFRESVGVPELSKLVEDLQNMPQIRRVEIMP